MIFFIEITRDIINLFICCSTLCLFDDQKYRNKQCSCKPYAKNLIFGILVYMFLKNVFEFFLFILELKVQTLKEKIEETKIVQLFIILLNKNKIYFS